MATMTLLTRDFWASDEPRVLGLTPRHAAVHYLALPLLLAFLSGWPQVGRTMAWPKYHALAFWAGMSFGGWWMNDLTTRLIAPRLRRAGAPLLLTLLAGVFLAAVPSDLVLRAWVHAYYAAFPHLPLDRPLPGLDLDAAKFLSTHFYGFLTWPLLNLGMFHLWKVPCFGYCPPAPPSPDQSPVLFHTGRPAFMAKIHASAQGNVRALSAEQHYLRVYTDCGEALILYRLSDAMRELGGLGLQVHRSHWVAAGAVQAVVGPKTAPRLQLAGGVEIPVSRSFRQSVEMAGFLKAEADHTTAQTVFHSR
jgi:hypothetical protein